MFSMLCYNIQQAILQCSADYVAMFSSDTIINRLCMFDYWRQQSIIQKKTQRNVEYLNLVLFVITLKAGLFGPQNLKDSQKCIKGKKIIVFQFIFIFKQFSCQNDPVLLLGSRRSFRHKDPQV